MNIIRKFIRWLLHGTAPVTQDVAPMHSAPEIVTSKHVVTKPCSSKAKVDHSQAHYYLGDLLEKLDEYFEDVRFLRRNAPDMADLFEKAGCSLMSRQQLISATVEPFFFKHLPAQGCFFFGRSKDAKKDDDIVPASFMYFMKHHQPINVQPSNGVTYVIGGVYNFKFRHVFEWHVAVFPDGTLKVLKETQARTHVFGNKKHSSQVVRMEWDYPATLKELARNSRKSAKKDTTLDEFAYGLFAIMVNSATSSEMDMNVRVRKNEKVATFAINMLRTPYFFADREKTVNDNGRTERILHIVRPHRRKNKNGVEKVVKAHWRGLRRFMWNGYDVSIGMPGTHYRQLSTDWTVEAYEEIDLDRLGMKGVDTKVVGEKLDKHMTAPANNILQFRGAA